jgi:hypothetical protein
LSNNLIREEPIGDDCREKFSRDWGVSIPWFYGYNEAMMRWLSGITLERPEEPLQIEVMYQTPERAFADIMSNRVNAQIVLPAISFLMTGASFDWSRFTSPPNINYITRQIGNRWQKEPKPTPWILNYNVTVWAKFQEDLDMIAYRLLSRFTPDSYLNAYGAPALMQFQSHSDTSDLEPADTDRILRHDFQFDVLGWMQLPFTEVGRIEGVTYNFTGDPEEVVDSDCVDTISVQEGDFSIEVPEGSTERVPGVYTSEPENTSGQLALNFED